MHSPQAVAHPYIFCSLHAISQTSLLKQHGWIAATSVAVSERGNSDSQRVASLWQRRAGMSRRGEVSSPVLNIKQ